MKMLLPRARAGLLPPHAPTLPDAEAQGGLGVKFFEDPDSPDSGPTMIVSNPGYMHVDDEIQVFWNDPLRIAITKSLVEGEQNLASLRVPPGYILEQMNGVDDRVVDTWYDLLTFSGVTIPSTSSTSVRVKLNTPGRPALDPDHPYDNVDLPAVEVASPIDLTTTVGVSVTVRRFPQGPAWLNMVEGDLLTLYWGDAEFPQPPLTAEQAKGQKPLVIPLSTAQLAMGGAGDLKVFYGIRDVVGNWSRRSQVKDVMVVDADTLEAPDVWPSHLDKSGQNVDLRLPRPVPDRDPGTIRLRVPYMQLRAGDEVTLTWSGRKSEGVATIPWTATQIMPAKPLDARLRFLMPEEKAREIGEGTVTLRYTVKRADGTTAISHQKTYGVVGGSQQTLVAPTITEAVDATLDPWKTTTGAHVVIKAYGFMKAGDRLLMRWLGTGSDGVARDVVQQAEVEAIDLGEPLTFTVPSLDVDLIAGGSLSLSYSVTQDGIAFDSDVGMFTVALPAWSLIPPEVLEARNGSLSPQGEATLRVSFYDGKAAGDRVRYTWTGQFAEGGEETLTGSRDLDAATAGEDTDFTISDAIMASLAGGAIIVNYTVQNADGRVRASRTLQLRVEGLALSLPPPTVAEARDDDDDGQAWLDPSYIPGQTATVAFDVSLANAQALDKVSMVCHGSITGSDFDNANVVRRGDDGNIEKTVTMTLPKAFVLRNQEGQLDISGTFARGDKVLGEFGHLLLNVDMEQVLDPLAIDPEPMTLVKDGPSKNRTATGGVPPYVYAAAPTGLVLAADDGTVSGRMTGRATLTVTDSADSSPVSYEINVVESLYIDPAAHTIKAGTAYTRAATNGQGDITYASSQPAVASVDQSTALVTGNAPGTTRISASDDVDTVGYDLTVETATPPLVMDETPHTLYVDMIRFENNDPQLPSPSARYQRGATGEGLVWKVSGNTVMIDAPSGYVAALNNGTVTVTVTDVAGRSKSYQLTVTGIRTLFGLGIKGNWAQTQSAASNQGARVPSASEVQMMRVAYYGRAPGASEFQIWTTDTSGKNQITQSLVSDLWSTAAHAGHYVESYGIK